MTETADRIQTPYLVAEDELDRSLRPRRLEEFVGQQTLREQLAVAIEASTAREDALDHLLLAGPPGLGKTSLAQIIAAELEVPFVQTAGPALERKGDIAAFLTALEPRSVFFVDEIHRLARTLEETFYPAMEDQRLPITVGQGAGARVVTLQLPPFTLIGATTRTGLLTTPLRDRFGIQARLEPYSVEELAVIVRRSAGILQVDLEEDGAQAIAARSRGTPRVANRLLKRVRDFAEVRMEGVITAHAAHAALEMLEVDERGLDRLDREILRTICDKFAGGPVGLSTLAVAVGEERDTIEDVYEPYLLKEGLIMRTARGRAATPAAFADLVLRSRRETEPRCSEFGYGGSARWRLSSAWLGVLRPSRGCLSSRSRDRDAFIAPLAYPVVVHGSSLHLPKLRSSHHRVGWQPRLHAPAQGLRQVRVRLPVRTARRLLPRAYAAFFVCDREGRVIGCGKNSFAFTGLEEEAVIGQRLEQVLGLEFANGDDPVATVLEWGVRALEVPVQVSGERDVVASATADMFPAYDDEGGLLLVLTPEK